MKLIKSSNIEIDIEYVSISLLFNCQVSCWHVGLSVSNWCYFKRFA